MNRGLLLWGKKGWNAVKGKLSHIHNRAVFEPLDSSELMWEERRQVLESHFFLEQKKKNEIKGRIVSGGNKQRSYTSKQETSSPTYHVESIFCTAVIDAMECSNVAVVDVPNSFVQTDLIKNGKAVKIIMVLRGRLADIMIRISPQVYNKYPATNKQGKTVLCVKLPKALYGLMEASLMFCQKFLRDLEEKDFKINPHDPCVANKEMVLSLLLYGMWMI